MNNLSLPLGSNFRPLSIRRKIARHNGTEIEHFEVYEVYLGGVSYLGAFTEPQLMDFLRGNISVTRPPKPAEVKPTTIPDLDLSDLFN